MKSVLNSQKDATSNYNVYCLVDGTTQLKLYQNVSINTTVPQLNSYTNKDYHNHTVRIWSVTKLFTNWATAIAFDRNLLTLDTYVKVHIPSITNIPGGGGELITVRHLLNHTSGLPNYTSSLFNFMTFDIDNFQKFDLKAFIEHFIEQMGEKIYL